MYEPEWHCPSISPINMVVIFYQSWSTPILRGSSNNKLVTGLRNSMAAGWAAQWTDHHPLKVSPINQDFYILFLGQEWWLWNAKLSNVIVWWIQNEGPQKTCQLLPTSVNSSGSGEGKTERQRKLGRINCFKVSKRCSATKLHMTKLCERASMKGLCESIVLKSVVWRSCAWQSCVTGFCVCVCVRVVYTFPININQLSPWIETAWHLLPPSFLEMTSALCTYKVTWYPHYTNPQLI